MKQRTTGSTGRVNREIRSALFTDIFSRKKYGLELVNGLRQTNYEEKDLKIVTLENVLTYGIHNDVAFCMADTEHNLIEHQSTYSYNMPQRMLDYYYEIRKRWMSENGIQDQLLHKNETVKFPEPYFYVLYNGRREAPSYEKQYLSDSFKGDEKNHRLEMIVEFINLRSDETKPLLNRCESLKGYQALLSEYFDRIMEGKEAEIAVREAIDDCIEKDHLREYLQEHRAEVSGMILEEWSYEKQVQAWKEEGEAKGRKEGRKEGLEKGRKEGLQEGLQQGMVRTLCRLVDSGDLTMEKAAKTAGLNVEEFLAKKKELQM